MTQRLKVNERRKVVGLRWMTCFCSWLNCMIWRKWNSNICKCIERSSCQRDHTVLHYPLVEIVSTAHRLFRPLKTSMRSSDRRNQGVSCHRFGGHNPMTGGTSRRLRLQSWKSIVSHAFPRSHVLFQSDWTSSGGKRECNVLTGPNLQSCFLSCRPSPCMDSIHYNFLRVNRLLCPRSTFTTELFRWNFLFHPYPSIISVAQCSSINCRTSWKIRRPSG